MRRASAPPRRRIAQQTPAPSSERLRRAAAAEWRANLTHPFVRGIGTGTLPKRKFLYFLVQDYVFLIDFSRVLALASAKAERLPEMTRFAELLHATLATEMELHRRLCAREGMPRATLERTEPSPTTRAYTDFLVRTAHERDPAGLVAALLPCIWGYAEVGQTLRGRGLPRIRRYAEWIETYASAEYIGLSEWCRSLYDRIGRATAADRALFRTAVRYEIRFWEAAWREERW